MQAEDKVDRKVEFSDNNGSPLSRQVTVSMSPEQYERLFFSPTGPQRGDLAKRLGNPTLLGLLCFLIPYTSTMFILIGWGGAVPPTSLVGLDGDYYLIGCIGMTIAGICEFILGNTFPFAVFVIYGTHWASLVSDLLRLHVTQPYVQDPIHKTTSAFGGELGGATGAIYNASQAWHNVTMAMVSFILLVGTLRVNVLFVLVFLGLVFLFSFIAAADFAVPNVQTAADLEHVLHLLRIGGGFGMLGVVCGWYLALVTVCEAVGLPLPLPVFDLSSKVFPIKSKNKDLGSKDGA